MSGVGIPKEGICKVFPEISRIDELIGYILRNSFLFLFSEFASVQALGFLPSNNSLGFRKWYYAGVVFCYSSLHLHSKYSVHVSQCIHSEVLKMETKMRECKGTCHRIIFFILIVPWNQKRAASLHLLRTASPWEITMFRINISLGIWLQISILLNQEEFILFLLLWLCMDF